MFKKEKIAILKEYQEVNALKKAALKRYGELQKQIKEEMEAGKYGDLVLNFEEREVSEYTVPARIDVLVKVMKAVKW